MDLMGRLQHALNKRESENAYRTLSQNTGLVDFVSNDYLGLSQSDSIQQKLLETLSKQRLESGSTGSRLLSGNFVLIESLESRIAHFHEAESALIFNSGYQANLGLLGCLPGKGDTILFDQYIHASLRQGIQLSYAETLGFRHNDLGSLEKKFQLAKGQVVVLVESLYSMDGDEAPLEDLIDFCESNDCVLIVDEAHATGIRGP
jgi:8-amino-7-oxononanoate synthase